MAKDVVVRRHDVDQSHDDPELIPWIPNGQDGEGFQIASLYCRAQDLWSHGQSGQDFIALRASATGDAIAFAVCDGVSQSFFGNLSAEYLGKKLADLLIEHPCSRLKEMAKRGAIEQALRDWTLEGQRIVEQHHLPDDLPAVLREILDNKRNYGSETVFCAGRLERGIADNGPIMWLCWMGNVRAHVLGADGKEDLLAHVPGNHSMPESVWDDHNRWSTKVGPRGSLRTWSSQSASFISRVIVYSDGLMNPTGMQLISWLEQPDQLRAVVQQLRSRGDSDDIALLDIRAAVPMGKVVDTGVLELESRETRLSPSTLVPAGTREVTPQGVRVRRTVGNSGSGDTVARTLLRRLVTLGAVVLIILSILLLSSSSPLVRRNQVNPRWPQAPRTASPPASASPLHPRATASPLTPSTLQRDGVQGVGAPPWLLGRGY